MNILLSNDDGIRSKSLKILAETLQKADKNNKIFIVAPRHNCSGYSHKITLRKTVALKKYKINDKIIAFSLSGTPADCVKYAITTLGIKFDVVISGINIGANLGTDIFYSGTFGAALEGAFQGVFSIALSSVSYEENDFQRCALFLWDNLNKLKEMSSTKTVWNINFPDLRKMDKDDFRFVPLGIKEFDDHFEKRYFNRYILRGEPRQKAYSETDVDLVTKNLITITPVLFDRTDYTMIEKAVTKDV